MQEIITTTAHLPGAMTHSPEQLPKGSQELLALMSQRDRDIPIMGYKPFAPVNDKQVAWAQANAAYLNGLSVLPDASSMPHRRELAATLTRFMILYDTLPAHRMSDSALETAKTQRNVLAETLVEDLAEFPLWAVRAGLTHYRKSEGGRFRPNASGELIPHIRREFHQAVKASVACNRILASNAKGNNVDLMQAMIDGETDPTARAGLLLRMTTALENCCNVFTDPIGRAPHGRWTDEWQQFRKANPLPAIELPRYDPEPALTGGKYIGVERGRGAFVSDGDGI